MTSNPPNIASEFVVLKPDHTTATVSFTPTLFERLETDFEGFTDHVLVSSFAFDADWPTWEMHPAGDEIVVLLSGVATFMMERDGGEVSVELVRPGDYAVVPKGTWHTAKTSSSTRMLFITPGEGTRNRDK